MASAERRAQLVVAASSAFRSGGFDGTSMDDVAVEAGVTRLIVYKHFESKSAVYRAVLDSVVDHLRDEFETWEARTTTERGGVIEVLLRVARAQPDGFRLLWRHAAHEPAFVAYAHEFRSSVDNYTAIALESRSIDPMVRRWAARTLSAHVIEGVCTWLDVGEPSEDARFVERHAAGTRALLSALVQPAT